MKQAYGALVQWLWWGNWSTRRKTCRGDTPFTTNPTWTDLIANLGLHTKGWQLTTLDTAYPET